MDGHDALRSVADDRDGRKTELIRQIIEELRPYLRADGGDCELIVVEGNIVKVRMSGACVGCRFSSATIANVQDRLVEALGMPLRIIPVPGR